MKITKSQLRQIIREEVSKLHEQEPPRIVDKRGHNRVMNEIDKVFEDCHDTVQKARRDLGSWDDIKYDLEDSDLPRLYQEQIVDLGHALAYALEGVMHASQAPFYGGIDYYKGNNNKSPIETSRLQEAQDDLEHASYRLELLKKSVSKD
jgi:hypothetical protein